MGDAYVAEMIRLLREYDGIPPNAIKEKNISPARYWWEFTNDLWINFCVQEGGFWRSK
jgi:hypothetical protein